MTDIGKVHWSKLWLRPLQCIHHCQEHKAVITASLCMLHPHTYTFYFLYSQTEAVFTNLPAAGISPKSQRAKTTHHSESIQSPCSRQWSWCCLGPISVGPGRCWYMMPPRAWLQGETLFLKIQHHVRKTACYLKITSRCSKIAKRQITWYAGAAMQCAAGTAISCHVRGWRSGSTEALWPEIPEVVTMGCCSPTQIDFIMKYQLWNTTAPHTRKKYSATKGYTPTALKGCSQTWVLYHT